jgi:hypothetical protein
VRKELNKQQEQKVKKEHKPLTSKEGALAYL